MFLLMNVKARLHRRQSRRQSDYLTAFVAGRRAAALLLCARRCPSTPPAHARTRRSTANPPLLRSNNGAGGRIIRTCPPNFNNRPRHSLNYSLLPAHKFSRHQIEFCFTYEKLFTVFLLQKRQTCSVFFSRPRSEGWPHHGHTFSIYPCPLSF